MFVGLPPARRSRAAGTPNPEPISGISYVEMTNPQECPLIKDIGTSGWRSGCANQRGKQVVGWRLDQDRASMHSAIVGHQIRRNEATPP